MEPIDVVINGNRLVVEVLGPEEAPVIIANHGGPGLSSRRETRASFGSLADEYRIVVFDGRGSGDSEGRAPLSHAQWAADVDGLREWCGADKIIVAGGSYGGYISLEYALRYPSHVSGIVLRDTSAVHAKYTERAREIALSSPRASITAAEWDRNWSGGLTSDEDFRNMFASFAGLYQVDASPEKVRGMLEGFRFRYETSNAALGSAIVGYDVRPQLPTITVPTLITVGRHDWVCPVEASEEIAAGIPGSELAIFENSGHSPQVEERELWLATVRGFLHQHFPPATV